MFALVHLNAQYVISATRGHLQIHNIQFDMGLDLPESTSGGAPDRLFRSNVKPKVRSEFSYLCNLFVDIRGTAASPPPRVL